MIAPTLRDCMGTAADAQDWCAMMRMIDRLRAAFDRIETVNPDRLPEFRALFDQLNDRDLAMLADARVKFVSKLAANACFRRGIKVAS
jgi:hypothetical protein